MKTKLIPVIIIVLMFFSMTSCKENNESKSQQEEKAEKYEINNAIGQDIARSRKAGNVTKTAAEYKVGGSTVKDQKESNRCAHQARTGDVRNEPVPQYR